jgi:hypothetical protein
MSKIAELWLESRGQRYSLSEVAPEFVVLRKSAVIPTGPAILVIDIDGLKEETAIQVLPGDRARPEYLPISRT